MGAVASGVCACEFSHAIRALASPAPPAAGERLHHDPTNFRSLLDPAPRGAAAAFGNLAGQRRGQDFALGAWKGTLRVGELGAGSHGGEACGEAWVLVESGFGKGGAGEWIGGCGEAEEACGDAVGVGVEGAGEGKGGGEGRSHIISIP